MKKQTDTKLAAKWNCTQRTIRNWRKDGAPLDSDSDMRHWLAGQKHIPPGTAALLEARTVQSKRRVSQRRNAAAVLEEGAPAELRRLNSEAAKAYTRYQQAIESGTAAEVKSALKNWLALVEAQRKHDVAIDEARRVAGEHIPREQIEHMVKMLGYFIHIALTQTGAILAPLAAASDTSEVHRILDRWRDGFESGAVSALQTAVFAEAPFPAWLLNAVSKGIGTGRKFDEWSARNAELTRILEQMFAAMAGGSNNAK